MTNIIIRMDCKELFAIFEKIGGEFICNYEDNTGTLLPHNIKCKNLKNAKQELDLFIFELSMYPTIFTEKKKSDDIKVREIHYYQDMSLKELSLKFSVDENGYKHP